MKRTERKNQCQSDDGVCKVDYVDQVRAASASAALPPNDVVVAAAGGFTVLSHPARLRILRALTKRELCVCDVAQVLGASMSATSQHLKELRTLGAVTFRSAGKLVYYRLADRFWLQVAEPVFKHFGEAARNRAARGLRGTGSA